MLAVGAPPIVVKLAAIDRAGQLGGERKPGLVDSSEHSGIRTYSASFDQLEHLLAEGLLRQSA